MGAGMVSEGAKRASEPVERALDPAGWDSDAASRAESKRKLTEKIPACGVTVGYRPLRGR